MNVIIWLIVGGVIGWLASKIMNTDAEQGIGLNVVVGIVGALLTGFFAVESIGGTAGSFAQFLTQLKGVAITVVYCAVGTYIILKVLDVIIGLRVNDEQETEGLDLALHDERGYNL